MKQAIDDLKEGMEERQTEEKRLTAAMVNQEGELCRIKKNRERVRNQIKDYEAALAVLREADKEDK